MKHKPKKTAQEMQDDIFRKMSPSEKIKMMSDFYRFAKTLQQLGKSYGRTKTSETSSQHS